MASKFGYVDRDADSRVNWADIGKSFSDMLITKREEGEAEFKALDNLATVAADIEIPLGENTTANSRMMDTSNDIKAFISTNNKLWKNGEITTYEYQRNLQNVTDNTDLVLKTFKNLNTQIANLNESNMLGNMSEYTRQNLDKLMKFSNLNDTKIVIQKDGTMVGNKLIPDGKGGYVNSTDPEDVVSLQAFANIFLQNIKKYDYDEELNGIVENLGKYQYVFQEIASRSKAGAFFKVEDITAMGADAVLSKEVKEASNAFLDAEEKYLSAMLANPYEAVSVLMDGVKGVDGDGFENCPPGVDCKELNKIRQIYTQNSVLKPELTKEQEKVAKDFLRSQLRSKLDRTVTAGSTGRKSIPSYRSGDGDGNKIPKSAELWNSIYSASPEQQRMYMKQLTSTDRMVKLGYKGGKFVELTDPKSDLKYKALEVYYDDASGKGKTKTGKNAIPLQIIRQDEKGNYFVANPTASEWNQMGEDFNGGANIRPAKGNYVPTETGIEAFSDDPVRDAKDYIRAMKTKIVDEEGKFNPDEEGFTEDFNKYYENLGFKADWTYMDGNKVKVTNTEDKDQPTITINPENEKELNDLINFMNTGLLDVVAENFMSSLTKGAATTAAGEAEVTEEAIEDKTGGKAR
jgi:hypothetical protein